MAVKPGRDPDPRHEVQHTRTKHTRRRTRSPTDSSPTLDSPQDGAQERSAPAFSSFSHLSKLVRLERYQSRRARQIEQHLYQAQVTAARSARLAHTAQSVQRTLAECIRSEDKHGFVNLFNAFHDALSDRSQASKLLEEGYQTQNGGRGEGYPKSFLDELSSASRTLLLDFLSRLKRDASFVADSLTALSHKELCALLPEKGLSRSDDSIFGSPRRNSSRSSRNLGFVVDGQTDLLSSHELASPLEVLIHSVRSLSSHSLQDDATATEVWATACAKLIREQKPGSEVLVPAVITCWASSSPWPGKERLEVWLSRTLQEGAFILEQSHSQAQKLRVEGRWDPMAMEDVQQEKFYTGAVASLLRLLSETKSASVIPPGALRFCRSIHRKLQDSPRHHDAFPNFAITRWLCPAFLLNAISLPETHGLLTDYFISDLSRQRILQEVASRCYRAVSDVVHMWKTGNHPPEDITQLVHALASTVASPDDTEHPAPSMLHDGITEEDSLIAVSATDVQTMVQSLFPPRTFLDSDQDGPFSGLRSSASSVSGFSLFQTAGSVDSLFGEMPFSPQAGASLEPLLRPGSAENTSGPPLSLEAAAPSSELDGSRLREACIGIDEFSASGNVHSSRHWCFLLDLPAAERLCTVHEEIARVASSAIGNRAYTRLSASHKTCETAIDDLLCSDDLLNSHVLDNTSDEIADQLQRALELALERRIKDSEGAADFVQAHSRSSQLRLIRETFVPGNPRGHTLVDLLDRIQLEREESRHANSSIIECCDALTRLNGPAMERCSADLTDRLDALRRLRDKLWYTVVVRTSGSYSDAVAVAGALRTMGKPPKPPRTRLISSHQSANGSKGSTTNIHLKTEAQVLDILTAPVGRGGRNKLGDEQSKILLSWMEQNNIENLSRGEERFHKLCMEIRKVVDCVTSENSALLSNDLLAKDRAQSTWPSAEASITTSTFGRSNGPFDMLRLRTDLAPSTSAMSSTSSYTLSTRSSRDYLDPVSPSTTNRSSGPFWSPSITEARSPSSVTSIGTSQPHGPLSSPRRKPHGILHQSKYDVLEQLRHRTTSLLISDIGHALFRTGNETDVSLWSGIGGELTERYLREASAKSSEKLNGTIASNESDFDFESAFEKLCRRFSASANPYVKLKILSDIDTLLGPYAASSSSSLHGKAQENQPGNEIKAGPSFAAEQVKVDGFRKLFSKRKTRPFAICRDLQYIASLVPSKVLDSTPQGKAFWNAAVAMSRLRQEICGIMVETADGIIAHHANKRGTGRSSSVAQQERDSAAFSIPNRTPSPENVSGRSISDAAWLLQITAKEGNAVAQRELATLYLTHPELMEHIILPLSRPRDVFKEELESKWRKNQDPTRCDPTTMCVAHHWMSLSSKGGDALATESLRQGEEMERLP